MCRCSAPPFYSGLTASGLDKLVAVVALGLFDIGWEGDTLVSDTSMASGPSAIVYKNKIYCFYRRCLRYIPGTSAELRYNVFDGQRWTRDTLIPDLEISSRPSATVYNNKIYIFAQGRSKNGELLYSVFDGHRWGPKHRIPTTVLSSGPATTVFQNKLYIFHQGGPWDIGELWYNVFDGLRWRGDARVPNTRARMSSKPFAMVYEHKLYVFFQGRERNGDRNGELLYNVFDGSEWEGDCLALTTGMSAQPCAIVYNGKMCLLFQGYAESGELRYVYGWTGGE